MLTKVEAQSLLQAFQDRFATRLNQYLINRAQSGFIGGTINYSNEDGLTGPRAAAIRAELEAAGWTVVVDTVNKTVTIS